MRYPAARRLDLVDHVHGRAVPDPYRWLEDPASDDTRTWSDAQDALARSWLDRLPGRDRMRARLAELLDVGIVTAPVVRGGRAFFQRRLPGQEHAALLARGFDGSERVLLDPAALSPDATVTLDDWRPSPDGRLVAYWLSEGGDEETALRVLDVETLEVLDGPIDRTRYCDLAWLPGATAFFYGRRLAPHEVPAGEANFHRRVYLHVVGTEPGDDVLVFGEGRDMTEYHGIDVSPDGRWLVITAALGTAPRNDVYLAELAPDLAASDAARAPATRPVLRAVQEGVDAHTEARVEWDGRLYLLTDRGAPRGRLAVADPTDPAPDRWRDLVPESDAVIEGYALAAGAVVVHRTHWALSSLTLHDRATGATTAAVELPPGTVQGVTAALEPAADVWFGFTGFTTPPHVRHLDAATAAVDVWADPPGTVPLPCVRERQVFFPSKDGTQIPMFVIEPAEAGGTGRPAPTQLYGYGGFRVSLTPSYSAGILAWVGAGGVYAVANLRGGSEGGENWHRAGMRDRKQNVFDDFAAAAEWLIDEGITTPDHLAIAGGSNGGLLVGAAVTQRPELFAAAVCSAPLLDMVRYERFGFGTTWSDEYGTAGDPDELGWLLSYSPYHHVRPGTRYPAVLFTVFESDTRVDPLHARKLCAALQWATSAEPEERPVLLRAERKVGHGARSVSRSVELVVDTACFLADRTGLRL